MGNRDTRAMFLCCGNVDETNKEERKTLDKFCVADVLRRECVKCVDAWRGRNAPPSHRHQRPSRVLSKHGSLWYKGGAKIYRFNWLKKKGKKEIFFKGKPSFPHIVLVNFLKLIYALQCDQKPFVFGAAKLFIFVFVFETVYTFSSLFLEIASTQKKNPNI